MITGAQVEDLVTRIQDIADGNYAQGASELIGGALDVYGGAKAVDGAFGPGCFAAGTPVLTTSGGRLAIERVALGRRVPTAPEGQEVADAGPALDADEYRVVRLRYVEPKSGQAMELAFLRHRNLLDGLGAGDTIRLSILELELDDRATVLGVDPAPAIESGTGRLVTGTIRSQHSDVRLLAVSGLAEPIEVTGGHPVYSEDQGKFVAVKELQPGERLRTRRDTVAVESGA